MQSSIEHIHAGKKCTKITPDHVLMLMLVHFTANHACGAGTKVALHGFQCSLQWLWTSQSSSCSGEQRMICGLWVFTGRLVMQGNPQQFGHLPQRGTPGTSCLCSVGTSTSIYGQAYFCNKGETFCQFCGSQLNTHSQIPAIRGVSPCSSKNNNLYKFVLVSCPIVMVCVQETPASTDAQGFP